jgi:capsular polysaccharide biosynthesis protein
LENEQQAEKFRVIDPQSLPEQPSFPNRRLFTLGGVCVGLLTGIGIVHFSTMRDRSLHTRHDVEACLGVPVLALISHTGSGGKIRHSTKGGIPKRRPELSLTGSSWKERNV